MQDKGINIANNHLRGTEYDTVTDDPTMPIRRGIITIDGAVLRMSVYPERMSKQGRRYHPIQLQYLPDCKFVLKAVPVGGRQ